MTAPHQLVSLSGREDAPVLYSGGRVLAVDAAELERLRGVMATLMDAACRVLGCRALLMARDGWAACGQRGLLLVRLLPTAVARERVDHVMARYAAPAEARALLGLEAATALPQGASAGRLDDYEPSSECLVLLAAPLGEARAHASAPPLVCALYHLGARLPVGVTLEQVCALPPQPERAYVARFLGAHRVPGAGVLEWRRGQVLCVPCSDAALAPSAGAMHEAHGVLYQCADVEVVMEMFAHALFVQPARACALFARLKARGSTLRVLALIMNTRLRTSVGADADEWPLSWSVGAVARIHVMEVNAQDGLCDGA